MGRPSWNCLRVLVVEDYDDARESLCVLIGLWGHVCETAADGAAALSATPAFLPDVVFMDIGLPGMDGYKVTRAMRELPGLSGTAFVAMTGYSPKPGRDGPADQFLAYLVKPVAPAELRELLTGIAARRQSGMVMTH